MSHLLFTRRQASSFAVKCAVGAVIAAPVVSICQASFFLLNYRLNYAHAPKPVCPARGALFVKHGCENEVEVVGKSSQPPLRVLVIGDSLAMGVGQTELPLPIMPVSIARSLSKALGGRIIDWTCHGKPGLSAAQLVKEIEVFQDQESLKWSKIDTEETKNGVAFTRGGGTTDESQWNRWKILMKQQRDFRSSGQYDIVVVVIGMGDLKNAVLPFLRVETKDNHGDQSSRGYRGDLERIKDIFRPKSNSPDRSAPENARPLVVFPALPGKPVPIFLWPPLKWFVIPLLELLDEDKREIASDVLNRVLFVREPTSAEFGDFEEGRGPHYAMLNDEDTAFAVTEPGADVKDSNGQYVKTIKKEPGKYGSFFRSRPYAGSTLVSHDMIHPNNGGYDFWGRCIASEIIRSWMKEKA